MTPRSKTKNKRQIEIHDHVRRQIPDASCSSVYGIFQARILEWVAMPSSRRSSPPRGQTHISYVSCIGRQILYH